MTTDLDDNGTPDIAVSCEIFSCILILTKVSDLFLPTLTINVPAGRLLATGDLDGDGHTDLIGSGDALWTALSSRPPGLAPATTYEGVRTRLDKVVINEILAINNALPVEFDSGKKPDWLELYNGTDAAVSLAGWKLTLVTQGDDGEESSEYVFPAEANIPRDDHMVVVHSRDQRSPFHAGFLPTRRRGARHANELGRRSGGRSRVSTAVPKRVVRALQRRPSYRSRLTRSPIRTSPMKTTARRPPRPNSPRCGRCPSSQTLPFNSSRRHETRSASSARVSYIAASTQPR